MDVTMKELLIAMIDEGGSDLHVRAYMPPELRVHGELLPLADEELSEEESFALCREISTDEQMAEVEKSGGADFALAFRDLCSPEEQATVEEKKLATRFRVSIFKERRRYGAVLRQIPSTLLTMEQLGLPPVQHRPYVFQGRSVVAPLPQLGPVVESVVMLEAEYHVQLAFVLVGVDQGVVRRAAGFAHGQKIVFAQHPLAHFP